eukprot:929-Chlamydomonas_euryale.AAC.1
MVVPHSSHTPTTHTPDPLLLTSSQAELHEERDKRARWHADNVRRRHNYVPFVFNMLRHLARAGQLS